MYWLLDIHNVPVECRFIVASKQCSNKPLPKTVFDYFQDDALS